MSWYHTLTVQVFQDVESSTCVLVDEQCICSRDALNVLISASFGCSWTHLGAFCLPKCSCPCFQQFVYTCSVLKGTDFYSQVRLTYMFTFNSWYKCPSCSFISFVQSAWVSRHQPFLTGALWNVLAAFSRFSGLPCTSNCLILNLNKFILTKIWMFDFLETEHIINERMLYWLIVMIQK